MSIRSVLFIRSVAFIVLAIVIGWNTSVWAKAHDQGVADGSRIEPSVQPFNVIGQHLFGNGFGASDTEVDDMPAVQIDIGGPEIANPALINVLDPDCQIMFQVLVDGDSEPMIIDDNFYGSPPKLCQEPGRDR